MKCVLCGMWTGVKETRALNEFTYRRRRECANGHRVWTYEVQEAIYKNVANAAVYKGKTMSDRLERANRDHKMLLMQNKVGNYAEVGRKFGVTTATARKAVLRQLDKLNGQRNVPQPVPPLLQEQRPDDGG